MTARRAMACLLVGCVCASARGHDLRPVFVDIEETASGTYAVRWRTPETVAVDNIPEPVLPAHCRPRGATMTLDHGRGYARWRIVESEQELAGERIGIRFPRSNPSLSTLVHVRLLSGQSHTTLLGPDEPDWRIPERETPGAVAGEYVMLGVQHILEGIDHLLFLVCLVVIAGTGRRVAVAVTGFTLGHSVTLSLAAVGAVHVPVAPIEAAIALSIVLLAVDIARGTRDSWCHRYPIVVASAFGLLHGFGFAAVLREIGLPQTETIASLVSFNAGVEIGQLLFVGALMIVVGTGRRLALRHARRANPASPPRDLARLVPAYVIGAVAAHWVVDRVASFWL